MIRMDRIAVYDKISLFSAINFCACVVGILLCLNVAPANARTLNMLYSAPDHNVSSVAISPDSKFVVYGIHSDDQAAIYRVSTETGGRRELFTLEGDFDTCSIKQIEISGDGHYAIFSLVKHYITHPDYPEDESWVDIYSVRLADGHTVHLDEEITEEKLDCKYFEISPDSKRVVFYSCKSYFRSIGDFELYSAPVEGGELSYLSSELPGLQEFSNFEITPDSSKVIFSSAITIDSRWGLYKKWRIFSIPTEGGTLTRLASTAEPENYLANVRFKISEDSNRVVFTIDTRERTDDLVSAGETGLYSVSTQGGEVIQHIVRKNSAEIIPVSDFSLSPDSQTIVYSAIENGITSNNYARIYNILAFPMNGGPPIQLNDKDVKHGHQNPPIITPDSSRVVFMSGWVPEDPLTEIFSAPLQGGKQTQLISMKISQKKEYFSNHFFVSPDSKSVVLSHHGLTPQETGILSFPINGGTTNIIHNTPMMNLLISGDSQKILYEDCTNSNKKLMVNSIHGGAEVVLDNSQDKDSYCYFSKYFTPDSSKVIYEFDDGNYKKSLMGIILEAPEPLKQYNPGPFQLLLKDTTQKGNPTP